MQATLPSDFNQGRQLENSTSAMDKLESNANDSTRQFDFSRNRGFESLFGIKLPLSRPAAVCLCDTYCSVSIHMKVCYRKTSIFSLLAPCGQRYKVCTV